ncbi:hypothetical protein R6Q57_003020 [Mikania cordata]
MGFQVLIMLIFSLCSLASFSTVSKSLVPDNTHENMRENKINKNNTTFHSGRTMVNQSKTLIGCGGDGRLAVYNRNKNENSGPSNTSPRGGGNGMVPAYAAGAAGYRRNHKGSAAAATYAPCWRGGFAGLIATSTYLLLHIPV